MITTIIPHIPVREELLERAVESVKAQTYPDREILICTDSLHRGADWAISIGVQESRGEWVTLLGDDDWLRPNHHQVLIDAQRDSGADVVYGWYDIHNASGEPQRDFQGDRFGQPFDAERERKPPGYLPGGGSLIRGDLLRELGIPQRGDSEFPPEIIHDDHAMYLRLMNAGATFFHVPERLYVWTHWEGNTSGKGDRW